MPPLPFVKMHGLGNDYVYVDAFTHAVPDPAALAARIADRHTGVGGDGLILVAPPTPDALRDDRGRPPAARMRMFNADGSESEMCGNGIRCVCKLVHDHRWGGFDPDDPDANPMRIQTGAGTLSLAYTLGDDRRVADVAVDMGPPTLNLPDIPVDETKLDAALDGMVFVGMGNPHAVLFIDDDRPLEDPARGAQLERHPAFPHRINVHFVRVLSPQEVRVYHWERGSGATLACGTGACAVCVAGALTDRTGRRLTAHLPGGPLELHWRDDNQVLMTGPAAEVFAGTWPHPLPT
ncbi:MAG: diaminopimelate epimerase [Planctomycetota bacterium]